MARAVPSTAPASGPMESTPEVQRYGGKPCSRQGPPGKEKMPVGDRQYLQHRYQPRRYFVISLNSSIDRRVSPESPRRPPRQVEVILDERFLAWEMAFSHCYGC